MLILESEVGVASTLTRQKVGELFVERDLLGFAGGAGRSDERAAGDDFGGDYLGVVKLELLEVGAPGICRLREGGAGEQ